MIHVIVYIIYWYLCCFFDGRHASMVLWACILCMYVCTYVCMHVRMHCENKMEKTLE